MVDVLEVRLIGRPVLLADDERVAGPRGRKAWALLARLVRAPEPLTRRRAAEELFGDADDPMGALRWTLAELRRRLGVPDGLSGDPIALELPGITFDVDDPMAAVETQGPDIGSFLEGVDVAASAGFESWLIVERQRIEGEIVAALRHHASRAVATRRFGDAVDFARAVVDRAPFEEGSHVLLVRALASSGDGEGAIRQVGACRVLFVRELGFEPGPAVAQAARATPSERARGVSRDASARSMMEAGLAAISAGAGSAGVECLRQAAGDAEASGDRDLRATALVELGTALVHGVRGFADEGFMVLEEALDASEEVGNAQLAAKALTELGYVDARAGRRPSAVTWFRRAIELADDDPAILAAGSGFQALNLADWGHLEEADEEFERALELSRRAGNRRRETWVLGCGGRVKWYLGDVGTAEKWLLGSLHGAAEERWTSFKPWPAAWLGLLRLATGDDPVVIRHDLEEIFSLSCQIGDPCWEGLSAEAIALTFDHQGEHHRALEWLNTARQHCDRQSDVNVWVSTHIHLTLGETALAAGDTDLASSMAHEVVRRSSRSHMDGLLERAGSLRAALGASD